MLTMTFPSNLVGHHCRCIKYLQQYATPKNVVMADDEFILHVEGTASSQRVIRHIAGQSWPGLSYILISPPFNTTWEGHLLSLFDGFSRQAHINQLRSLL